MTRLAHRSRTGLLAVQFAMWACILLALVVVWPLGLALAAWALLAGHRRRQMVAAQRAATSWSTRR